MTILRFPTGNWAANAMAKNPCNHGALWEIVHINPVGYNANPHENSIIWYLIVITNTAHICNFGDCSSHIKKQN